MSEHEDKYLIYWCRIVPSRTLKNSGIVNGLNNPFTKQEAEDWLAVQRRCDHGQYVYTLMPVTVTLTALEEEG